MQDVQSFTVEFKMTSDFIVPSKIPISRFIKNRVKVKTYSEYNYLTVPSVLLQIQYTEELHNDTIMWKEIMVLPKKLEKKLLPLLEKAREYDLSQKK